MVAAASQKSVPKRTSAKELSTPKTLDVNDVLGKPYPATVAEYAVQVYYQSNGRNPNFTVSNYEEINNEEVNLFIDGRKIHVNIRTGKITK